MQSQENIEKQFFQQLRPGDYIDAKYADDDWKLAKVIDRQNKYLGLIYDGCPPNNQQTYINPMRVKPLRAVTIGYTGPLRGIYSSITWIPQLSSKHITMIDAILGAVQASSSYKISQYLRGQLFCIVNSLLLSDYKLDTQQISKINSFFVQLLDRIGKICKKSKQYLPDYFDSNPNNKYAYLINFKIALICSLQQLLYLVNSLLGQGNDTPRFLKMYKSQISQQNLYNHMKQYTKILSQLCAANDSNGRWLPTQIRIQITKILTKYKLQDNYLSITYDIKDYLQFYAYWPIVLNICSSKQNQQKLIQYILNVVQNQSPFDAKLKSLLLLKKILQKQIKLNVLTINNIIDTISKRNIVDSLLKYFNPQIFKRYIPILKIISQYSKKTFTQNQIDDLFKILQTCHQSQAILIYQIIVSLSEFINIETLDNIYIDIEKTIDINCQSGIKFVRDFTIKAIYNYNTNKNKGFLNALIGRKKNSSKFGYYGLDLLCKEIQDGKGKVLSKNIAFAITNIGIIFNQDFFQHERMNYMQNCIGNIQKRQSYGQSIRLLHQIICTYPTNAFIGESQQSVVGKLDDKFKLVDSMIKQLKPLQKQYNGLTQKKVQTIKVDFLTSIRYCYNFIQHFNHYFKFPMKLIHINYLWHMPGIFNFLRKSKDITDSDIPSWKRRYYKKISHQMIKDIFTDILKKDQYIIPSQECFDAVDQLLISYNLNKSIELTQRATIRYVHIGSIVGLNFYFKFLDKLIAINKNDWKQNKLDSKSTQLVRKVITKIFQFHLRPSAFDNIQVKCENWILCLMKVVRSLHNQSAQLCVSSIQQFLQLIKGRQFKDISFTGKIDIIVEYDNRQKVISLLKNSTILRLRQNIMQVFKIKWNFAMYNKMMKRQITYVEEQDYSVNSMGHAVKGPTISVRRVQNGTLYPQHAAQQRFMSILQQKQQFYTIVFGLLKKQNNKDLHRRIWKLIDKIPVNKSIKNKIQHCEEFNRKTWQQLLQPSQMQQLQYSINIIYNLLSNVAWMDDFKKSHGNFVIQQLYLLMLGSSQALSEKIITNLSKILLKILQSNIYFDKEQDQKQKLQFNGNLQMIGNKIMENLENQVKLYQQNKEGSFHTIQYLNLIMKILLVSSIKRKCPQNEILINFFLHNKILIKICQLILFQSKDTDTQFFTQDILQKIVIGFKLQISYKYEVFKQFVQKFLNIPYLASKKSTQNFFIFLIDFIHSMDKQDVQKMYQSYPQIVTCIKLYIWQIFKLQNADSNEKLQINQQMIHGCLKLFNQTFSFKKFEYDEEKIFAHFLDTYVLIQGNNTKQITNVQKSFQQSQKSKIKQKKILYDILKKMIFQNQKLLNIFITKIVPKLQKAEWRRNTYISWNLQQQKKQKKFYCGLQNLAATCYINCLFQQLFMIKRFTDRFIRIDSLAYKESAQQNQIYQLQKLLTYLKYGNKKSYTTKSFCQSFITYQGVPIDPTVQNDADQFFNALMEKVESFLKSSGHHYILQDTFEGKLSNQLNCQGCPHSSQKIQPFLSIGLDIKNKKTLEKALDGYVQGQILDGDNAYYCQKCDKKVRTMKRLCIKSLPNILVLVLKRFSYNFDEMRKIKMNDELKFSQQLNIKKYTSQFNLGQECKPDEYYDYKLRGVVVHAGTSQGGHYYSFVKQQNEGNVKWYQFNDQFIQQADYKRIQEQSFGGEEKDSQYKTEKYKNAYILFYEKKNIKGEVKIPQQKWAQQQSYENQLAQVVKSENRNADFLSVILDQHFIRLCENVTMCGQQSAHYFILLYFHTVLLRDRNKQEYLAGIYRLILTLMTSNPQLSLWYLQQIDNHYVREFLIESPRLSKYLCLGFVIQAIKIICKQQKQFLAIKKQVQSKNQIIANERYQSIMQLKSQQQKIKQTQFVNEQIQTNVQFNQQSKLAQSDTNQTKQEVEKKNDNKNVQSKQIVEIQKQKVSQKRITQSGAECIDNLIPILVSCLKKKGMTPFAKIFTYLASIEKYKQKLIQYNYPQRVCGLLLKESKIIDPIQYEIKQSYFGRQSVSGKQKQLQLSYTFLIQSMKYFPGYLSKQNILNLLSDSSTRIATKSLTHLLAQTSTTGQQIFSNIDCFQLKIKDQKYKKQDVERYLFLIRAYFLNAVQKLKNKPSNKVQLAEAMKTSCLNSLGMMIENYDDSYLFMELTIIELNKLANKCPEFKKSWIAKVNCNQKLIKSLQRWITESGRPQHLLKSDQFKKKIANLSYDEKEVIFNKNRESQEQRTFWMLPKDQKKTLKSQNFNQEQFNQQIPQIYSDLQETQIHKQISIGFRSCKIREKLGILTKVQDEKGVCKWAILERNEIETYLQF